MRPTRAPSPATRALLDLAKTRDGKLRLVTTNFDRLFEAALRGAEQVRWCAPALPPPKRRWDSLVYLHGLLAGSGERQTDSLVLSSGDFGLAYLVEGWAARFVAELFRRYTVCFVGYSVNDPVLRYMADAIAADRGLGESLPELFAFAGHDDNSVAEACRHWWDRQVTPIPYASRDEHALLRKTLAAWSQAYRVGTGAKEAIAAQYAGQDPATSSAQDDFASRVAWALTEPMGLAAKAFAQGNSLPGLGWLGPLSEQRLTAHDLACLTPYDLRERERNQKSSLLRRPAPGALAPPMAVAAGAPTQPGWDQVMRGLAGWLARHADDPKLLLWAAAQGGCLHPNFAALLSGKIAAGMVRPAMASLWNAAIAGRLCAGDFAALLLWLGRVKASGLTASARLELRELLAPRAEVSEPLFRSLIRARQAGGEHAQGDTTIADLVRCEVVPGVANAYELLEPFRASAAWAANSATLLREFAGLLRDALDLSAELGGAGPESDFSFIHQPSIATDDFRLAQGFIPFLRLTRDAWLAAAEAAPDAAVAAAREWSRGPYPVFRRLAFFAAKTRPDRIPPSESLSWLFSDDQRWLWSPETKKEAWELAVTITTLLPAEGAATLEAAAVGGPPRSVFRDDAEPGRVALATERDSFELLGLLKQRRGQLGDAAGARLAELAAQHPGWRTAAAGADGEQHFLPEDLGLGRQGPPPPKSRRKLATWLRERPDHGIFAADGWEDLCRSDPPAAAAALFALARDNEWPEGRWASALYAWSSDRLVGPSWRRVGPLLLRAPELFIAKLRTSYTYWLRQAAMAADPADKCFPAACQRALAPADDETGVTDDPLYTALNHPAGQATEALLRWWHRRPLALGQGLGDLAPIFSGVSDSAAPGSLPARVILASDLTSLYQVDPEWTGRHLIPKFSWDAEGGDARALWQGFLSNPRYYPDLVKALQRPLLETAAHYDSLGRGSGNYAALLARAYVEPAGISDGDLRRATASLPREGLEATMGALASGVAAAGKQGPALWRDRVRPYLNSVWPNNPNLSTPGIASAAALLCIAAGEGFGDAFGAVSQWVIPATPDLAAMRLRESGLCGSQPETSLALLDRLVGDGVDHLTDDFRACLRQIAAGNPVLAADRRFRRLNDLARAHGLG